MLKGISTLIAVLIAASGCTPLQKNRELLKLSGEGREKLATHYASVIEKEYPPTGCILSLSSETPFGKSLTRALQEKGYRLSDKPIEGSTDVSYLVDNLGEGIGLSVVSVGETLRLSRSFRVEEKDVQLSSMTVERRS